MKLSLDKKLSIIIPCYNEENNLNNLISQCVKELCKNNIEVILVDNGSNDGTSSILKRNKSLHPLLKSYRLEKNIGYGGGIIFGLSKSKSDFLGWTHADLQTSPGDVLKGYELIKKTSGFVKGTRIKRSLLPRLFSAGMAIFESIIFKTMLWEINAQPKIFSREFYESWENPPNDYSLDLYAYVMAKKHNLVTQKFKVLFPERLSGQSSWNTGIKSKLILAIKTIKYSLELRKSSLKKNY